MVFTKRFKILASVVGALLLAVVILGLSLNQYILSKQLSAQVSLDNSVMKTNTKLVENYIKEASKAASLMPTPTKTVSQSVVTVKKPVALTK